MFRKILGVLGGAVIGSIAMLALHALTHLAYPPPADLDWSDQQSVSAWIEAMPAWAMLLAVLCHWGGTLVGALVATLIGGRRSPVPGIVVGVWFLIGGVANMLMIPAPLWVELLDLVGYVPVALLGVHLVRRPPLAVAEAVA